MISFLKKSYSKIWVPVFGRFLSNFIFIIEGKPAKKKPTYDIDKI